MLLGSISVNNPYISDHYLVTGFLLDKRDEPVKQYLRYCKLKDINSEILKSDLKIHYFPLESFELNQEKTF